ncbi:MAG: hypothetical protein V2J10_04845, partial [Wenzhouxiangella sp.]|nr:hypothetical protein [Wenzhouxiangella sp.]
MKRTIASCLGLCTSAVLAITATLTATPATAEEQVWVRIHDDAAAAGLERVVNTSRLEDYGSFFWGPVSAEERAGLERMGLRLSVSENPYLIVLGGERIDLSGAANRNTARIPDPDGDWHLVQFDGPVRPEWLQSLAASGVRVAQPVHPFGYYVWAEGDQALAMSTATELRWSGPMRPQWKLQPHLRNFGSEIRPTMALASAHADRSRLLSELDELGTVRAITALNTHFDIIHIDLPGDRYERLAELPAIFTVQYIRPEMGPRGE